MIQLRSRLEVADNTGARMAKMIGVIGKKTLFASVGDVITFRALGSGVVVTHRIVDVIERDSLAGVHYQTRGDANDSADPDLVPAGNVIALVNGSLPAWQRLAVELQTPMGRFAVYGSLFLVIALGEIADVVRLWRRPEPQDES